MVKPQVMNQDAQFPYRVMGPLWLSEHTVMTVMGAMQDT